MGKQFSKEYQPTPEQRKRSRKKITKKAQERRKMREIFEAILTDTYSVKIKGEIKELTAIEGMCLKQLQMAMNGSTKSFELIRDTIGEKPVENIAINTVSEKDMKEVDDIIKKINNE